MALDFIIDNDTRKPAVVLSLSADSHWKIVEMSKRLELKLTSRFYDYYEDGQVEFTEMPEFLRELRRLRDSTDTAKLRLIVEDLTEMAIDAERLGTSIRTWAD
jgi:hypothetical protein